MRTAGGNSSRANVVSAYVKDYHALPVFERSPSFRSRIICSEIQIYLGPPSVTRQSRAKTQPPWRSDFEQCVAFRNGHLSGETSPSRFWYSRSEPRRLPSAFILAMSGPTMITRALCRACLFNVRQFGRPTALRSRPRKRSLHTTSLAMATPPPMVKTR